MGDPQVEGAALIFVVEDDESTRALIERYCERGGFEVESFADAESCIAALSTRIVDAVLLDLGLQGIDRLTALRGIHERLPLSRWSCSQRIAKCPPS